MNFKRFSLSPGLLLLGILATFASAQESVVRWNAEPAVPSAGRAVSVLAEAGPLVAVQTCGTLEITITEGGISEIAGFSDLVPVSGIVGLSRDFPMAALVASLSARTLVAPAAVETDVSPACFAVASLLGRKIELQPDLVLELVESEVTANPSCACEIVKSAIRESHANPQLVAGIVEVSAIAAPEHIRLISQCAIAAAPDSMAAVQEVLARMDPCGGDQGSGPKDAKVGLSGLVRPPAGPDLPNPLDLPPSQALSPAPIHPPAVTFVDPR